MLAFECEDGTRVYNRFLPLFWFAYGERLPVLNLDQALHPVRRAAVWVCAALVMMLVIAAVVMRPGGNSGLEDWVARTVLPLALSLLVAPPVRRGGRVRVVERGSLHRPRLAPPVLLVEWSLAFSLVAVAVWFALSPFWAWSVIRGLAILALVILVCLALLPWANALWFTYVDRSPGWSSRGHRSRGLRIMRPKP